MLAGQKTEFKVRFWLFTSFIGIMCCLTILSAADNAFADTVTMQSPTSGKKVDVRLEQDSNDTNYNFKITFLQHNSQTVQVHIDYDFRILQNGTIIFDAAKSTNQKILHTAEGIVTIPYKFKDNGSYHANVTVNGIYFLPIDPESATFPVVVTPEFPSAIIASAGLFVVVIVFIRTQKFQRIT